MATRGRRADGIWEPINDPRDRPTEENRTNGDCFQYFVPCANAGQGEPFREQLGLAARQRAFAARI